jgi:hypothetical protein
VAADYAPGGQDVLLDDFEPAYSIFAMLDLTPDEDSIPSMVALRQAVDRQIVLPIEQMGCDIVDVGLALAALYEGLDRGLIPPGDVPSFLAAGQDLGRLERSAQAVACLREGTTYPALRAAADGPQALAARYPAMQDLLFTCGRGTLGNPGHANKLWTFLMPFSRFFGHYSGQIYKIAGEAPPEADDGAVRDLFRVVVAEMLQREYVSVLCNALSCCAFVFAIYTWDGDGVQVDPDGPLLWVFRHYGIDASYEDLMWFAQAFWAQSIALKLDHGWRPPSPVDYPRRVYEALALALGRPVETLERWMSLLIGEWADQAGAVMDKFGYSLMGE